MYKQKGKDKPNKKDKAKATKGQKKGGKVKQPLIKEDAESLLQYMKEVLQ